MSTDIVPESAYKEYSLQSNVHVAEMFFVQTLDRTELPSERVDHNNMWVQDATADQPWLIGHPTYDLAVDAGIRMLMYWGRKTVSRFTIVKAYVTL